MDSDLESLVDVIGGITITNTTEGNPYWYQFTGFTPNPKAGIATEFKKLVKHMRWTAPEQKKRRVEAFESEFNYYFVAELENLEVWQNLCREIDIDVIPASITQCKKKLRTVHVNLVNLINHKRNPNVFPLIIFPTFSAFLNYTKKGGRCYPKSAKADGFVNGLLREVFNRR